MKVRALILAAGAARRFGGPKQLASVRGRPLLDWVIDAAWAWHPLVVLGAHASQIRAVVEAPCVLCADWQEGQAASLRAGVAELGDVDAVVVLLGDQPFITPRVISEAVTRIDGVDAVRTTYSGAPGHPVVLGRPVLARVPELHGDVGARELLRDFAVCEWEAGHLCDPTDVDTPQQLEALRLRTAPK